MAPSVSKNEGYTADYLSKATLGNGWQPQYFSHVVTDRTQVEILNSSGSIAVDFEEIPKSPIHLAFSGGKSQTLCLWTTASHHGFKSTPKSSVDLFTLRFVTQGALVRRNLTHEAVVSRADVGTIVDFEDMQDEQASSAFSSVTATVSKVAIVRAMLALNGKEWSGSDRFAPSAQLNTVGLRALRQTLVSLQAWLCAGSHQLDLIGPMLEELLIYQLISAWPMLASAQRAIEEPSQQAFKRAVDYMEAGLHRQITMPEIANASGITVRALQIAFKRELGCSPIAWLINRRLDRVRDAILELDGSKIREIAMRWGFVHMSDFSRRYRQRFGQLPRTTKRVS